MSEDKNDGSAELFAERSALRIALFHCVPFVPSDKAEAWAAINEALRPLGQHGKEPMPEVAK